MIIALLSIIVLMLACMLVPGAIAIAGAVAFGYMAWELGPMAFGLFAMIMAMIVIVAYRDYKLEGGQ